MFNKKLLADSIPRRAKVFFQYKNIFVCTTWAGVKKARLEFTRLSAGECSLVRIRLHTGRSHQIRVQFASRGYPLVGDHKYGSRDKRTDPMLFSCCIRFPWRGEQRRFEVMPDFAKTP